MKNNDTQDMFLGGRRCRRTALARLLRLENAVTWYGGGWDSLVQRALERAEEIRATDQRTVRLLDDVVQYLQDVAIAGDLPATDWRHDYSLPTKSRHD